MVDVGEQLQVLLSQGECVYQTSDYITRMQAQAGMVEHDEEEKEIQDITMAVTGTGTGTAACTTSSSSSSSFDTDDDSSSSSPTNTKKHRLLESSSHAVLAEQECHHTDQCQRTATTTSPTTTRRSTLSSCINKNWREQICKWAYDGTYRRFIRIQFRFPISFHLACLLLALIKKTDLIFICHPTQQLLSLFLLLLYYTYKYVQWLITLI